AQGRSERAWRRHRIQKRNSRRRRAGRIYRWRRARCAQRVRVRRTRRAPHGCHSIALRRCAFHEIDSSWIAFEIAGRVAMRKGAAQAGVTLLEPIMSVAVDTIVTWGEKRGNAIVIRADAPLAHLLGYAKALRSISGGRASCTMCFSRYAKVRHK